jgi:hypothetical protein
LGIGESQAANRTKAARRQPIGFRKEGTDMSEDLVWMGKRERALE